MREEQLSKNWSRKEFRCRCAERGYTMCGGCAPILPKLITLLQELRNELGVPLYCVSPSAGSGFRCIAYNELIGGVAGSYHTLGMAADIWSDAVAASVIHEKALEVIEKLGYGWVKYYPKKHFVHIDIGER